MLSSPDEVNTLTQKLAGKNIKYAVRHIDYDNGSLSDFIRIGLTGIYRPEMLYRIYVEQSDMSNARRLLR